MKESAPLSTGNSEENSDKSSLLKNIAFILGAAVLGIMIYKIGPDVIMRNIRQVGWWMIAIVAVWGVVYLINTIAWRSIVHSDTDIRIPFSEMYKLTVSGYALNYVTPMGLLGGEPYRIYELRKYVGIEKATSSVILYAMMHICSHFFFWITSVALIAWFVPVSGTLSLVLTAIFLICLIFIVLFFRGYRKGLIMKLLSVAERIPFVRVKVKNLSPEKKERFLMIDNQIVNLHGKSRTTFYFSLFAEYMARMINSCEIYLILIILGQDVTYIQSVIIVSLSSLFANILFFSPMQLGTREGGLFLAFKSLGINPGISVSVSMLTRIREMIWIMIGLVMMRIGKTDLTLIKK